MASGTATQRARDAAAYRLPGTDRLGRWALAGLGVSLVLHGIAFFALDKVKVAMGLDRPVSTGPIRVERVESAPMEMVTRSSSRISVISTGSVCPTVSKRTRAFAVA